MCLCNLTRLKQSVDTTEYIDKHRRPWSECVDAQTSLCIHTFWSRPSVCQLYTVSTRFSLFIYGIRDLFPRLPPLWRMFSPAFLILYTSTSDRKGMHVHYVCFVIRKWVFWTSVDSQDPGYTSFYCLVRAFTVHSWMFFFFFRSNDISWFKWNVKPCFLWEIKLF